LKQKQKEHLFIIVEIIIEKAKIKKRHFFPSIFEEINKQVRGPVEEGERVRPVRTCKIKAFG